MTGKQRFASDPVNVGHGFSVEFSFTPEGVLCEWTPDVPNEATAPLVFDRYQAAMAAFIGARMRRVVGDVGFGVTTRLRNVPASKVGASA